MLRDNYNNLGRISIVNHWLLAALMIGMLVFGLVLEEMPRGAGKRELMGLHKSIGILILFLGMWRVGWRLVQAFPTPAGDSKNWEKRIAKIVHIVLLAGILLMPLSGYLMSSAGGKDINVFGLFVMPNITDSKALGDFSHSFHGYFPYFLIALIILHVAAAIKHHFISKDNTLKRMFGLN